MIILGIDPGLINTGYGIIQINGNNNLKAIDFGIISPDKKEKLSYRLKTIYDDLSLIIKKYKPNILSIEEVFFGKNVKSALLLGHARGVAMLCASNNNIPVFEYSPRKIKQSITGNGNADKSQVKFMVNRELNLKNIDFPDDASDALAIALCHNNQIKLDEL
tara:strand:- start:611 stop:1096 length:486 start_codon:yes stop_codon:yes gene_type:complete